MNEYSLSLMHEASEVQRLHFYDKTRAAYASGDKSAARRLANARWYQANKGKKQAYNKQYYQQHKEYWQQFYTSESRQAKARQQWANEAKAKADDIRKQYGENSKEYKRAKMTADLQAESVAGHKVEAEAAKLNIQRAQKEYDNYMKDKMQSKITKMWSDGVSQIKDAGKKFVNNIKVTGIYLNARQKYWDWRNGR